MDIAIVGGGVGGLTLALALHQRGVACRVYESAPAVRELGVGITLLPHAMREMAALGLAQPLADQGIENRESCFFNRFGQLLYAEPRGRVAGYPFPEIGIHRGRLHGILWNAAIARLGAERILSDHQCVGLEQSDRRVTLHFRSGSAGAARPPIEADVVIGCDGVNSAVRRQFYPGEELRFVGINTWRGVTRSQAVPDRPQLRPRRIDAQREHRDLPDRRRRGRGGAPARQLDRAGDPAGLRQERLEPAGPARGRPPDLRDLDVRLARRARSHPPIGRSLRIPDGGQGPDRRWTFGRVTLLGDAAHPMYPRGSNGAAQAIIDARTLADRLAEGGDPRDALRAYEAARSGPTAQVVLANRAHPPDYLIERVEELVGDRPFDDLDRYITQAELRRLSDDYKRVAGFALSDVTAPGA